MNEGRSEEMHKSIFPRSREVCPPKCPRRCADPNCHNPETCERCAVHLAETAKEYEKRRILGEISNKGARIAVERAMEEQSR